MITTSVKVPGNQIRSKLFSWETKHEIGEIFSLQNGSDQHQLNWLGPKNF